MPEVTNGPPPMVRAPTGFHGEDAARLLGKEAENFFSGKLFAEPNTAVGTGAMRLEGPLRGGFHNYRRLSSPDL